MNETMAADSHGEDGPKGVRLRERFQSAALEVFLEKGFESAPMADIVRRAGGGSLSTLYELFGSKDNLFEEAITARVKFFTGPMEVELGEHTPLREGLTRIGEGLLAKLLEEGVIGRAMPQGDILGLAPPLCLTKAEADKIVTATQVALKTVSAEL